MVGAGLAGLAAAGTLHRAGRSVAVLEASDGVGGRVRTDVVDGHRLDRGFQVLLTAYPELSRHLDLDALDLRPFEPGALVRWGGRFHRVGDPLRRPGAVWSTLTAPIGSPADKARIARLQLRLRRSDPRALLRGEDLTTLESLRSEGFGEAMIDRFLRPLFSGIQLDPDLTTSRRMFDVIFRCLALGDSAVPATGMGAIPTQMADALPAGSIHLGREVAAVGPGRVAVAGGGTVAARAVVVAAEGPRAATLLDLPAVGSKSATGVWFAAPRAPIPDRLVVLDGTGEGPAANVAVLSNVAPAYAPAGDAVVVAALPGVAHPDAEPSVRAQLRDWWGPAVDGWRHLRTHVIPHGQPAGAPPLRPKQRVALGEGLFVCGDHRDTGSIQGALFSGRRCAEAVTSFLG